MTDTSPVAVVVSTDDRGVARVTMARPEIHNAFDDKLIAELTRIFRALDADPAVRVVVLAAEGKSFSAGADLNWMRRMAGYGREENLTDAGALGAMVRALNDLSKPTLALVQGAAYGGGVGLVAACDIAIATPRAKFALTEVKLGIIPAVISPYVINAVGLRWARRLFVTAEAIDADRAREIGLIHEVVAAEELEAAGERLVQLMLANGPEAMAAAKDLAFAVAGRPIDDALVADTAARIADRRASDEGREGLTAFLEKRTPSWRG